MPTLDVSEAFDDPDFVDYDIVRRRSVVTVDTHGRGVPSSVDLAFSGVVTAFGIANSPTGEFMTRAPEGATVHGAILIHTQTPLTAGEGNVDADVVLWNDVEYTVTGVNNYSKYGSGFYAAVCKLRPLRNV